MIIRRSRPHARLVIPVLALLLVFAGCGPASFLVTPVPVSRSLEEHVVERESFWASKKIALIDVDGILSNARASSLFGPTADNPVVLFKEKLDRAAGDSHVAAIVLRINSPGGGVTATDLMYGELLRFKERTRKPVIACMLDVAASGGYYLACGADRILAHPTTVTGSIGVIMMTPDVSGAMEKLGIGANVIKSGLMKDSGSPFRAMTTADRAIFQGLIDRMYERFIGVVATGRPGIAKDKLHGLADGRVYLAPEAKENGLIDELGTLQDAIVAAKKAAGLDEKAVLVVEYAMAMEYRPNIYAQPPPTPGAQVIQLGLPGWLSNPAPQFQYLWAPGWE